METARQLFGRLKNRRKIPLLSREFGNEGEMYAYSKTGKKKWVVNQSAASKRANEMIAKAHVALQDPHTREQVRRRILERVGSIPKLI
jgi:hypothetical protein